MYAQTYNEYDINGVLLANWPRLNLKAGAGITLTGTQLSNGAEYTITSNASEADTLQSVIERWATFEAYNKNLLSYPYEIEETSWTITTIVYTTPTGTITKVITEVSPTVTTIVLSGIPAGLPTTKTITEWTSTLITYS